MRKILIIIKELFMNFGIIYRVSKYEDKADYQNHYLGIAWEVLSPLIQIATYYLVFGLGLRGNNPVNGTPFMVWMLFGISAWFFMNKATLSCSSSIYKKVGMVSKMKFPISILPAITIFSHLTSYFVMTILAIITALFFGIRPSIHWLQFFYYFISMLTFIYFLGLLNSTITILVRDYQQILRSLMRILFYFSGAIWVIGEARFPAIAIRVIELNPFFYIIDGFRDAFLSQGFVWEKGVSTLFFWLLTLLIAIVGSHLHLKFRSKFVDLL